ncbi:Chemotaxis protein CheA [Planktothrix tepida]|uniref:histidine kinase n=2 Tax=Planktothrix TaxID=54304 RepID=A0A1J1LHV1_9CYAN|nr:MULTISPECIES: response regulator [Planktothrix]CAD5911123.1 Chemotaxis protein CheA [Planktothrix pseudagardhii]CAD5911451.1 Chemotaxis protein CheA [Planktothrix tepida]CUR32059.1 CheA Signal Transduction Histidine Kinases (STHK) [Planktothrix tepida PCC 9214]
MQLEQQQRIMGYFIEEAKDHLNTIEQGLLNLQTTVEDPELLNEVFRAAHSVKGGAAMLGLNSIQQTAHRLEDSFKILKENRLPTQFLDQQLESLFLQVFDTLQALIDQLSGPYGLTEEAASAILQDVEPVFEALNYHIKNVVQQQGTGKRPVETDYSTPVQTRAPSPSISKPREETGHSSAKDLVFGSDVPERLREMLQQFKQPETPQTRQVLIETCRSLARAGELFDLPNWVKFIENVEQVIANSENTYRSLAPVVIKAIKEAQDLVLANRETEIVVTEAITRLLPKSVTSAKAPTSKSQTTQSTLPSRPSKSSGQSPKSRTLGEAESKKSAAATKATASLRQGSVTAKSGNSKKKSPDVSTLTNPLLDTNWSDSATNASNTPTRLPNGPEITPEEYNSLRDLFEGLDEWDHEASEETVGETPAQGGMEADLLQGDFFDLLDEKQTGLNKTEAKNKKSPKETPQRGHHNLGISPANSGVDDDLASFFDNLSDTDIPMVETPNVKPPSTVKMAQDKPLASFEDFFDELLDINPETEVSSGSAQHSTSVSPDEINDLLEDAESLDELFDQFDQQAQVSPEPKPQTAKPSSSLTGEAAPEAVTEPYRSEDWFDELLESEMGIVPETSTPSSLDDLMQFGEEQGATIQDSVEVLTPRISQNLEAMGLTAPNLELPDDDFTSLDALLNEEGAQGQPMAANQTVEEDIFLNLDQLLQSPDAVESTSTPKSSDSGRTPVSKASPSSDEDSEFTELLQLIEDAPRSRSASVPRGTFAKPIAEPIVKVPVKQLDNLSNLMGELVVNRNSLEQDQERMRQFLDNLLHQVSLLGDVGQRMQDFYERSLLEISLLSHRRKPFWFNETSSIHDDDSNTDLDSTELDRFTPFHTLSQEIIELIVRVRESSADIEFLVEEADQVTRELRRITTALQEGLNRARMEPFAIEADALKRPVRDISIKCGKQAELFVEGRDTLIDKMLLGKLHDPLIHLVNNAITHGIEPADVRTAAGKSAVGRITIRVFHQGNQTIIAVSDDGGGIDVNRVKNKAIQKGLITAEEAESMSNPEIYDLLFLPNFSTKDVADEYAGRGVGMDVVRTSLTDIRGTITTDSTLGRGTSFTIRLPLNMSISRALCCVSDRVRIAFPMDGVEDMIDVPREQIRAMDDGSKALEWRGTILPLRHLRELLTYHRHLGRGNVYGATAEEDMISVIVLRSSSSYLAVQVDQVLIEQEIVIKPLEGPVPKPIGIAGATVLGDGQIVAIADVLELIDLAMGRIRKDAAGKIWQMGNAVAEPQLQKSEPTVLIVDDSITVRSLLSITFEKSGYRVEEARDGKEAWEKLKSGLPCDIVFCDIEMPRMDGLELLSRMQKDPILTNLPIAMLTSRGADRHRQMAFNLGARGYFTKPYLEEQLLEAAGRMLKGEVVGNTAVAVQ